MRDFLRYVLGEVKSKRLAKADAIELIRQFQTQNAYIKPDSINPLLHKDTPDFSQRSGKLDDIRTKSNDKREIPAHALITSSMEHLKALIAEVTKIPLNRLDIESHFEELGLDSIMITGLNQKVEQWIGKLDATLFFKYNSIKALGAYIADRYPEAVCGLLEGKQISAPVQWRNKKRILSLSTYKGVKRITNRCGENIKENEDIAIIGIAGHYPKADSLEQFWKNLYEGRDCIEEIPSSRWSLEGFFEPDREKAVAKGLSYSKWGGFLENIDCFDPLFFNIAPRDAIFMDPQERLFLETAWECLEDAGYTRQSLRKDGYGNEIGIFVGATFNNYQLFMADAAKKANRSLYPANSQIFSIANRVSYIMNFTGPSLTVDTACASSLYAIHLACESIRSGQAHMAIAGGVNLNLHPSKYILLSQGQFSASDGRCRAFCEGGTGYVPAEAAGAVFLKPLQEAVKDGDHIYGVIKGTAVSHAGKTNGYTVPSPVSQSLAIERALLLSHIEPRSISCIEAHGTGTALGDPIEITGLTDVFSKYTPETGFCSISSVKSNIGHAEAAAGIGQLTKVLLQFKHQTLVKNVMHGEGLNPNIDFSQTPFFVQKNTEYWERPIIGGQEVPRRAGISSFGAGGANAHIIVEEYIPEKVEQSQTAGLTQSMAIVVLSANNEDRLKEQAKRLLDAVKEQHFADADLSDIAYTLQVGREAMEERLAVTACSIRELEKKLRSFVEGKEDAKDLYRGHVKRNKGATSASMEEDFQKAIDTWIDKGEYTKLLEHWADGLPFDWNRLYSGAKPRKISLPTYPFAKERYWVNDIGDKSEALNSNTFIHPLLHQNTSSLSEQRFSSTFTGQELFLNDHIVKGKKVLPGVVYLEMARAAVESALDEEEAWSLKEGKAAIKLKNVVWARPIAVEDSPVQVHIGLFPENNEEVIYEIYTKNEKTGAKPIIHSQGSIVLSSEIKAPVWDIKAFQIQCNNGTVLSDQCYAAFSRMGIDYGRSHQGIEKLYLGPGKVLAKLSMPLSEADERNRFVLHPGLMDSALQASIGLVIEESGAITGDDKKPPLPFALQELEVFGGCTQNMWAIVRYSDGTKAGDKLQKLDIDLCNEQGAVCIRISGLLSRILEDEVSYKTASESSGILILNPVWEERSIIREADIDYDQHIVMLCELSDTVEEYVKGHMNSADCISLCSENKDIDERFCEYSFQVFEKIQSIFKDKNADRVLLQIVIPAKGEQQLLSGLSGLLKTARLENPKLIGQLIELESEEPQEKIVEKLMENRLSPIDDKILYRAGKRYTTTWEEVEALTKEAAIPWKDKGVYLNTGGAGGIGLIIAKEIAHRTKDAALIITGRSALSEEKKAKLDEVEALGIRIIYKQTDVTKKEEAEALVQSIRDDFGNINGIIHSAGVIRDGFILRKTKKDLKEVLAPKVTGLVNIDQASRAFDMDFFILFSSGAGALGNPGQADYSAANAFLDAYAEYRNSLVESKKRQGQTLAVDWTLWKDGGMRVNEETEKLMTQNTGMMPMRSESALWGLYQGLASGRVQVLVMEGRLERMRQKLPFMAALKTLEPGVSDETRINDDDSLLKKIQIDLKEMASRILKVDIKNIDINVELEEYGFDPVKLTELANMLNRNYELALSNSELFEHRTFSNIADYLMEEYHDIFMKGIKSGDSVLMTDAIENNNKAKAAQEDLLKEKALEYLKKLLSSVIKLPANRIEADAPLEKYGIDSVMVMQLTNELEKVFGSLSKTLFFEYQNIQSLTDYFIASHREQLANMLGINEEKTVVNEIPAGISSADASNFERQISFSSRRSRFIASSTEVRNERQPLDIAVIGVSGRYPGADNVGEFWENLRNGKDCIIEIPKDRWDHSLYFDPDKNKAGKTYGKWGGFIDGVDKFDPLFFNISPREAEIMDPQERLFLECVYETLEDAGYTRESFSSSDKHGLGGNVGVYVGVMHEEYPLYGAQEQIQGRSVAVAGSPASTANRVSYFCNFHGPSIAIDTMCSSSLTAIHLACQSLKRGECDAAIAGGVNVSIHPNKYLLLGQGKFISSKGRCESFGYGGDGYVPGEGVGAVLLKPLSKAIADNDNVYGIIKAIAINHGGKTNGYSVPNPNAQSEAISRAFREAGINPRTVSYIEAHGTGTSLGDPIEITGLTKTFQEYTKDKQFCAIGSAKSNIGHCESAAGIAGVTKVLMQLKYRQLAPSLHSEVLNPNIDFNNTPFVVQQELADWKRPVLDINGEAREYPRIAGISSFGAGGSNAHLVIEEYIPADSNKSKTAVGKQAIVVLSAKNEKQLRRQAEKLLSILKGQQFADVNLIDMAYTLQVGREAMDERIAMLVGSIMELEERLEEFLEDRDGAELYRGQVKRDKEKVAVFAADEDLQKVIDIWISKGKYEKLLDLWVKGLSFDWNKLYDDNKPHRISLPAYPFDRKRYWVPELKIKHDIKSTNPSSSASAYIHPLVHQNTSDFSEQRFSSAFNGQEFFLADHIVKGQKLLPGVAYIEMARAAINCAIDAKTAHALEDGQTGISLKNIVWIRPIAVVDKPIQVHIGLYPKESGEITYEIYGDLGENNSESAVYSQGSAVLKPKIRVPDLDIDDLRDKCSLGRILPEECYEAFRAMGIYYGPAHQGIEALYVGEKQVLAKLTLPPSVSGTLSQYVLHPSLMDSSLQAAIGLAAVITGEGIEASEKPVLPFALQELEIINECVPEMWAYIRYSDGSSAEDKIQKLDIDLCNSKGNVCMRIKGFSSRVLEGEDSHKEAGEAIGLLMLEPYWKEQPVYNIENPADYVQHIAILCEQDAELGEYIEAHMDGVRSIVLQLEEKSIDERFKAYAIRAFEEIQGIIKNKSKGKVLIQIIVPNRGEQKLLAGLSGLLKTAQLENPKLTGQLIQLEYEEKPQEIVKKLKENSLNPIDSQICYQLGKRYVASWKEARASDASAGIPWKSGGIYLITGGAGGLGTIFAKEIIDKVKNVTLILTGRAPLNEEKQTLFKELGILGARIEYKQVDVAQENAVDGLFRYIKEEFGRLDGIIHAAGVAKDNYILKKSREELSEVLAPKVSGVVNIDRASKDMPLDFFIMFSSGSGAMGNSGQADYSMANAFMDEYSKYRNSLAASNQRPGKTLAIDWPLWKAGGMHVDEKTEKLMWKNIGMIAMQIPTGIKALYLSAASDKAQIMVMEGDIERMKQKLLPIKIDKPAIPEKKLEAAYSVKEQSEIAGEINLKDRLTEYLIENISDTLKVSPENMDKNTGLDKYGLDSVMVLEINNKLEKHFPDISKTLFFEYNTIDDLAAYFIESYKEVVEKLFQEERIPNKIAEPELNNNNINPPQQIFQPDYPKPIRMKYLKKEPYNEAQSNSPISYEAAADSKNSPDEKSFNEIKHSNMTLDYIINNLHLEIEHPARNSSDESDTNEVKKPEEKVPDIPSPFKSFAPFEEEKDGFSFSKVVTKPEECIEDVKYFIDKQIELRKVLFHDLDFNKTKKVIDIGCGTAADLISIAKANPSVIAHGLTISRQEAEYVQEQIYKNNLGNNIKIFCEDNTKHDYENNYDIAFGIQVMHFINELSQKNELFKKLASAISSDGKILLAEYICNLNSSIEDNDLNVTVHTSEEWIKVLSNNNLLIEEIIDASEEIKNFLNDPDLEQNIKHLDSKSQAELRKYSNQVISFNNKWISYCIIRIVKDRDNTTLEERVKVNLARLKNKKSYKEALEQMEQTESIAIYNSIAENFPDFFSKLNNAQKALMIHESELKDNKEISEIIDAIDRKNPPLGYERLLYPYFFIGSDRNRYLRIILDKANELIIPFIPIERSVYQELLDYSRNTGLQLLLVDHYHDWIDTSQIRLIPLGVYQNIDIDQFKLSGNKMRRLRYLVEKFKKSGSVRVEEYDPQADLPLSEMRDLMIKWSQGKKNIIHHSFICMTELLQKTLTNGYRAFLTYHEEKLCSIIVIEQGADEMYVMDQEFYDPEASPLGHMEYAIVEIIEQLRRENSKTFSLGLTWYPLIFEDNPQKDEEGWTWLKEQNEKQTLLSRIFSQGETNYQFKKKFGVDGEPLFAYLPKDAPFSLLLNYWPVFYQNSVIVDQLTEQINSIALTSLKDKKEIEKDELSKNERLELLGRAGKVEQLDYSSSPLDLMTDSWFYIKTAVVKKRAAYLGTKPHNATIDVLKEVFPFKHIVLTGRGQMAEQLFYQAYPKEKKKILTTVPWTTTLMHQLNNSFEVIELPDASVMQSDSDKLFKGEMDLKGLKEEIEKDYGNIAMAGLEVLSNASGGHPVRLLHMRQLKKILKENDIPLVLDASRVVRNSLLIKENEDDYKETGIWDIVRQTLKQAEYVVTSLTKDFAVPQGGLIATNDDQLAMNIREMQIQGGHIISESMENAILQAFSEPEAINELILRQMSFVRRLSDMLVRNGVPILRPAWGHAVVIDVSRLSEGETNKEKKEQFIKDLFIEAGIRGGIHQIGKQKNTILDQCVRLAIPLGLSKEDEQRIYNALQAFFIKNNYGGN